jgi:hypothetical protein
MKEKIIEIVGFNMEPERAELIAQKVLDLFAVSGSLLDDKWKQYRNITNNEDAWCFKEWLKSNDR